MSKAMAHLDLRTQQAVRAVAHPPWPIAAKAAAIFPGHRKKSVLPISTDRASNPLRRGGRPITHKGRSGFLWVGRMGVLMVVLMGVLMVVLMVVLMGVRIGAGMGACMGACLPMCLPGTAGCMY